MKIKDKYAFGNTGIDVPPMIFGTSALGNLYQAHPFDRKLAIMEKWFECVEPPVVIDTAGKYGAGLALETIGKGLDELNVSPENIIISNKLGWYRVPLEGPERTFERDVWVDIGHDAAHRFGYNGVLDCWRQGNELLGGKYGADLVSLHDPDEFIQQAKDKEEWEKLTDQVIRSYQALFELKEKGEVLAVGIGAKDWQIIKTLYSQLKFDWVMMANSFTIMSHPPEIIDFLDQLQADGVGIVNSAVFHSGFLTGGEFYDYRRVDPGSEEGQRIYPWREKFTRIAEKHGVTPSDACIHFALSHPAVSSIALNTSKPEKIDRNAEILMKELPSSLWDELKEEGLIDRDYAYI